MIIVGLILNALINDVEGNEEGRLQNLLLLIRIASMMG